MVRKLVWVLGTDKNHLSSAKLSVWLMEMVLSLPCVKYRCLYRQIGGVYPENTGSE